MNADECYSKLDSIISDTSKFVEISVLSDKDHPILAKEKSINYCIKNMLRMSMTSCINICCMVYASSISVITPCIQ